MPRRLSAPVWWLLLTGFLIVIMLRPAATRADYLDDIGYRALATQLGAALPKGERIRIDQVEAPVAGGETDPVYRADPTHPDFDGVTFHDVTAGPNPAFSSHATGVALLFAGTASMTPAVRDVDSHEANDWLGRVLYDSGAGLQRPVSGTGVLANHSWVGATATPAQAADILQRLDWLIDHSDFLQVVGVTNTGNPLLSNAYNVIGVTFSGAAGAPLTAALDTFYAAGRPFPALVAPRSSPSGATAVVTSAVALLLDGTPGAGLPGEVVKALLMAGADRVTRNTAASNLQSFAATTANGLDPRYGAGQLNILQSHQLLAAGETASLEDGGAAGTAVGFDYDSAFGGAGGSNSTAMYVLGPLPVAGRLQATLVWNALVTDDAGEFAPTDRVVHNLDLQLTEATAGTDPVIATSLSVVDNTETVAADVFAGRSYRLNVVNAHGSPFMRDYALAWRVEADRDRDGLFDKHEPGTCPAAADADSDDDGLRDGTEDTNLDGVVNDGETDPCDGDTDGDGLQDGTELGVDAPIEPAEGGAILGTDLSVFIADADPTTTTSPTTADSDGDGIADGIEDGNRNGAVDPGESNPNDVRSTPEPQVVPALPPLALGLNAVLLVWLAAGHFRTPRLRQRLRRPAQRG